MKRKSQVRTFQKFIPADFFKSTFFPSTIVEGNKLDWKIKSSESTEAFEKKIYYSLGHLLIARLIAITLKR